MDSEQAAAIRREREEALMRRADGRDVRVFASDGTQFTVVVEDDLRMRVAFFHPVDLSQPSRTTEYENGGYQRRNLRNLHGLLRILLLVLGMNIFEMPVSLKRLQIDPEKLVAGTNRSQGVLRARAFSPGSEYREPF